MNIYTQNIFFFVKFIVVVLLLFYCSRDGPKRFFVSSTNVNNTGGVKIPENHTFKIAIVAPLMSKATQTVPTWSTSGLVATLLAIDAINNKTDNIFDNILPNTTIVYEIFDSKQDTVTAAKIAPQLLQAFEGKGADIVLGAGTSGVSMALQSILKYFDTAQVSPSATSGYLSIATDFPFFARIIPTDGVLTDAMIQFAKHIVGWKSCAIVSGNDPYSVYGGTALRNAADLHNLEVSSFEIFSSGTNDMSVPISNAVQSGARLFFYFGLMTDLYTFQKTLHKYLTIRGDIEEGFSIIYPKITKATLEALEKEFKSLNEQHIFDTVINASYTVKITIRGGGMSERFQTLFKNAIQSNIDCFNKNVSGACSDCLGKKINPLTNLPIFHYEKQPNKPKICIAPNSGSGIGYYPQFNFDSVLMIANAYHKIIETNKAVTFGKDDFMTTVTSPSFSFYGATGFVKLDDKGDRLRDGISFDIGKMKISSTFYNVSSKNLLYKVGTLHIRGESPKFEFCKVNSSGALNTCDPSISFNTKDNSRPDPIDSSILRINLGIVTSTFHATAPYKVDTSGGQRTLAILVAIDEINNLKSTLRRRYFNSTPRIVYKWKNSGRSMPHAAAAASYLIGGTAFENHALVDVAIGAFSSGPSISMQSIMKSNNILQISPSSTSTSFSDKLKYPTFARTIPSDVSVSQVLVKFVKTTLDWQEISIISSDTDYASSGMTCIINEAKKANLMISANIVVQHNTEKSMYQESINALKAGNRAFIVFLHSSDILLLAKAMEKAAKFLQIDVSNICFVFTETILGLIGSESLPVILNGSFALKSQNGQNHDLHKAMFQNIHNKIASAKSCQSHDPAKTLCDCIEKEWRYIFFIDHDYDTSTPKKCGFPSTINVDDYYVPFAYDAVLTVAKLYDYIISRKKLDVIGEGVLKETLFSSKIEFEGATGSVKFTSVGDRIVEDMQFRVLNIYNDAKAQNNSIGNTSIYMNNANLLKTVGTITLAESFAHCTPSVKNETSGMAVMRCVPRLVYSTKDGKQPTSVVKACKINLDCGETGLCLSNGQCQCAPGRVGINCQQKLFSKREEYTNNDGSERCLKFIAPRSINTENSTVSILVHSWTSQALVSEIAAILLKEIMGFNVHRSKSDNDESIYLENWNDLNLNVTKKRKIEKLGSIGYAGAEHIYTIKSAQRPGWPLSSYAAYRKLDIINAMNSVSFSSLNLTTESCLDKCKQSSSFNCQILSYCNNVSGIFENPICKQNGNNNATTCGTLYAPSATYNANHNIEKIIIELQLPLRIVWLGDKNLERFVTANIDSSNPVLFYWWEPTQFYSANAEKFLVVNVPSSVAFKRTKLFKYVPEKVHPTVRDFVSHFKVSKKSIHGLLSTYYSKHQNVFQVACDFLKVDANLQTMLSYIPTSQMDKPLRIANNINSVSSNVITKLLQILCEEYLQTKVSVIRSSSDLESMDRLGGDKLDLIAEVLLKKTDKDTDVGSSQYDFRVIGPFSQRHLYLNIPKSFKIIEDSVNHWLYSDTLVSHLPPVGTFPSDVDACTLWFCNQGRYTPTHCMGSNSNGCGEILISTGFRLFPEKMSILIEIIQNLNLPFVINFVTNDVLALALSNEQYVIAFFSCDTCLDTKHFSVDLPYISLPEISKSCETSTDTTYEYDRKILGAYNCDFPVAFTHTVAKKHLYETFPAVHTLIKRMRLTNDDITTMSIFMNATFVDRDLTLSVRNWMSNKEQVWSKWMIGCINVPGKYGVEGKCKSCPPGTFSSMGSNICTPCFKGTFTLELNREKCFNCPSNTVSEPGMHGLGACKCMEQIGNATVGCRLCPLHGLCKLGSLSVMNGFWRFNKTSEEIFKCRLMEACLGASIPSSREIEFYGENEAHNESCLNGHYGILCDTCLPDYTKDFNGFCHMCDRSWVTTFFNVVTVLLLIAGVYFLMRLFVNSEPNIDGFHAQIKNFRELKNYDHACMYFRDYKVNSMRLFDYSSKTSDKTSNMEKRKFTRQVSKHNVFSITSERTTQSDAKIAEVALPKKIIISESIEEYKELQSCIYHKNPKSFLETDKIYSNLFKDEIKEIAVAPITTDLNEVRGIFIVAIAKENKICLHEDLKSIEDFVKSHEDDWSSQSESILSSLIKILISHFQIFASMKHIILPWGGSMIAFFNITEQISSIFTSFAVRNKCVFGNICGSTPWIFCRTILIFCLPFLIVFVHSLMMAAYFRWSKFKNRNVNLEHIKPKVILLAIVILYNMYLLFAQTVFSLNSCRHFGTSGWYMAHELTMKCYTENQRAWMYSLGVPGWILFIIGIPVLLAKVLYQNRHTIGMYETRRLLGALYDGYRMDLFYWETIIMFKKLMVVGIIYLFEWLGAAVQIPSALMVCCMFIGMEFHYKPYTWRILQNLERVSLSTHTISLLLASLFQSKQFRSKERRWVVEMSITFFNIAFILYFILIIFYKYRNFQYNCRKKKLRKETLSVDKYDRKSTISTVNPLNQVSVDIEMIEMVQTKTKQGGI